MCIRSRCFVFLSKEDNEFWNFLLDGIMVFGLKIVVRQTTAILIEKHKQMTVLKIKII